MKYVVLNIETLGIDFSNGMPHDFEIELINAGCLGHVPLDRPVMIDGSNIMIVHNCDITKLTKPESLVYQTDSDADWKIWIETNTIQVAE